MHDAGRATRSPLLSPSRARIRSTIATVLDQPDDLRALRVVHKTLADVNRLRILRRLAASDASVTQLIEHVGLSQPLVSWHLGRLRADAWEAFVERERLVLGLAGTAQGRAVS